jgi:NHLM bacteriocin system ABC transporter ATP-binding protein
MPYDVNLTLAEYFRNQGEPVAISGRNRLVLEGSDNIWYIDKGVVEVRTVSLNNGVPLPVTRSQFLTVKAGQCLWGAESIKDGIDFGYLADGDVGTQLFRMKFSRLQKFSDNPVQADNLANLINHWLFELSWNLTKDLLPHPKANVNLANLDETPLKKGHIVRSGKGALWIEAHPDTLFLGNEDLSSDGNTALFPLTPDSWIEVIGEPKKKLNITARKTVSVFNEPHFYLWMGHFNRLICRCKIEQDKINLRKEIDRQRKREEERDKAIRNSMHRLASVFLRRTKTLYADDTAESDGKEDVVFAACKLVGNTAGIPVKNYPETETIRTVHDKITAISKASRFRMRPVLLKDNWYKRDQGPLLASLDEIEDPVALLPDTPTSYSYVNTKTGKSGAVDEGMADTLNYQAFSFYRPFHDGPLNKRDLLKFGLRGMKADLFMLLLMGALVGALGSLTPYFTGQIFDMVIPQAERNLMYQFTVALLVAALSGAAFNICQGIAVLRIQGKMDYSLQAAVWDRLLNLPSGFFRRFSAGDLADRVAGINKIRELLAGTGVSAILGSMTSVFYVVIMFMYSMKLALAAISLTFVLVIFTLTMNVIQLRYQRRQLDENGKLTGLVLQLVSGVAKLRVTGAENFAFRRWAKDFAVHRRLSVTVSMLQNVGTVVMSGFPIVASMVIYGTLVLLQSKAKGQQDMITTGQFIAFSSAYGMFQAAMLSLSEASMDFLRALPTYERLEPIITAPAEIDELKAHPGELTGSIELAHTHFRYDPNGPFIIKDVSFKIRPGEFVAIVGGSGSGKSTLLRLLMGFEIPETGTVYYGDQDIANLDLREVRRQIGVVLQDSHVMPTTIFNNIIGTSSLTLENAWEAARMAGLDADIKEMPMGMHTVVSEGGGGFSGGQRQRLMIARAVVRKPRIIFLDEATSALDNRTQAEVTKSLDKLQSTRIVIAHRLSTIINADRIFVLDHGEIRESGTYDELMAIDGIFAELAKRQIA